MSPSPYDNEDPIRVFIEESRENLERLDREVVTLERTPTDRRLIGSLFRTLHTMKASCGFFDFHKLREIAHAGENLLGTIRDGVRPFTPRIGSILLRMADRVRACIDRIERTGTEDNEDDGPLIRSMESALLETRIGIPSQPVESYNFAEERSLFSTDSTIRVNVAVLDRLMEQVGELVLVRNQFLQRFKDSRDPHMIRVVQQLDEITGRLHDGIMQTRMQPIRAIWNLFPRLVRDTAAYCEKEVSLQMSGADTEIDRSVIEAIRDPLMHLIRNAIDHGIESPTDRIASGKRRYGTIHLHAEYENGQVILTVGDDGRGISTEKVRDEAIRKGMIAAEDAARLTPEEAIRLIFLPSFSTADSVTQVSGRGVGMDVVKTNIESIGGEITIHSVPAQGTEFRLRIPLSLAIVQGLVVQIGHDRFIVPQTAFVEAIRLEGEVQSRAIQFANGIPTLRIKGRTIPVVDLPDLHGREAVDSFIERDEMHVLILEVEPDQIAMIVDEVFETEEIIVKSLGEATPSLKIFSGATTLGDGTSALVIDVAELAHRALTPTTDQELSRATR